jgi:hypothetical protein
VGARCVSCSAEAGARQRIAKRRVTIVSPVGLPDDLISEINAACAAQNFDAYPVIQDVSSLTEGGNVVDYLVWAGRGYGQEDLRLDVYVLGDVLLYNYSLFSKDQPVQSSQGVNFLDALEGVSLVRVADEQSPYLLVFRMEGEVARAFGGAKDRERLQRFQRNMMTAIQRAKNGGK